MNKLAESILVVTIVLVTLVGISLLWSIPIWGLWNWLMPTLFGVVKITWVQALGISLLCGFLFNRGSTASTDK